MAINFSLDDIPVRQQMILFGLILVGCAYFFWSWYLQPLRDITNRQEWALETLRAEVQQAQLVQAQLPQFRAEVEKQRRQLDQFRTNLPSEKETPRLMRRIQDLAQQNNLNILTFTPQQVIRKDFYADWPIQISLEGSFHNLGFFFEKIGRLDRLVNVGDLTIRAMEESAVRDRTIAATCTATTFVYTEEAEAS